MQLVAIDAIHEKRTLFVVFLALTEIELLRYCGTGSEVRADGSDGAITLQLLDAQPL